MSSKPSFFAELQRRHVYKVGAAYAVAGWLLVQIVTQVFPVFDVSALAQRMIVLVIVAGFPIALALAWVFDITPAGIVRTEALRADGETPIEQRERRGTDRKLNYVLGALLLFAIGYVILDHTLLRRVAGTSAADAAADKSIAVLPLATVGADDKDSYLGDGISGELLTALSKLPGLKVIGRASSFQFRGRDVDAAKVGKALNVRSLLSGTVQRAGDELRITVELVDTASGQELWSQHYDRSFKNLFALEDDISGEVSKALAVKLGAAQGQPLVPVATDSPHAHDLYLRASLLNQRSDEASLNQALVLLNEAIAEDPNYAAAWALLSLTYVALADAYRAPNELLPAMKAAAEKAVSLDPTLAEAHAALSLILLDYVRDFPAARREMERAVALGPDSAPAHGAVAAYRFDAEHDAASARVETQKSEQIDPLNPWNFLFESGDASALGDFQGAENLAHHLLQLDPKFFYGSSDPLLEVYAASGRWQLCIDRGEEIRAAGDAHPDWAAAICHARAGDPSRAREALQQMETAARTSYVDSTRIAALQVALGDKDGAFAALDQADRDRSANLMRVWAESWFLPLHDDPRFRALLDRIGAGTKVAASP
jgi:TolB-like protein/Tfp pilus assembly protein PilF